MSEPTQTWRVSGVGRFTGAVMTVGFGLGAVALLIGGLISGRASTVGITSFCAITAAIISGLSWLEALRPCITADAEGLRITNPFHEYTVPWGEIEHVTPGYSGLIIKRRNARSIRAWAVQKSNMATAANREVRADRIAAEISRWAAQAGHETSTLVPSTSERLALGKSARKTMVIGLSGAVIITALRLIF